MSDFWKDKRVAVLGGAALIGSHLVEALLAAGAKPWVVDNLSSGKKENLPADTPLLTADLRDTAVAKYAVDNAQIVFHLASQHGGRGFVSGHKIALFDNLALDTTIFRACAEQQVDKVVLAGSACAYPVHYQDNIEEDMQLNEAMIDYNDLRQPDGPYGLQKLTAEMMLDAYVEQGAFSGVTARMFTVYGPRIGETHAIGAMIARTLIRQDPFEIWGDGNQKRNWTYVTDTVDGLMRAAEFMNRGAVNIGTEEVWTPYMAAELVWEIVGWFPRRVNFLENMPTGPVNRIANAKKAHEVLGWWQNVGFVKGLRQTIDWYIGTHKIEDVAKDFQRKLTELK